GRIADGVIQRLDFGYRQSAIDAPDGPLDGPGESFGIRTGLDDERHKRGPGILAVHERSVLQEWKVNFVGRRIAPAILPNVFDYANYGASAGDHNSFSKRIFVGEKAMGEFLIDDQDRRCVLSIVLIEIASGDDLNVHHRKITRAGNAENAVDFFAWGG